MKKRAFADERRVWTLVLALAICVFLAFNAVVTRLQDRFGLVTDLTDARLYELNQGMIQALSAPEMRADIYVFAAQDNYPPLLRETLSRVSRLQTGIVVNYVDPYKNPVLVERYAQSGLSVAENDIVIERDNHTRLIKYEDMLIYAGERVAGVQIEQALTSAVLAVSSDNRPVAAMLTGHGEQPSAALSAALEQSGFEVRSCPTAVEALGSPAIAVMAAPVYDYSEAEIDMLGDYLSAGGRLMAFIGPGAQTMPNLEALFSSWGMTLGNGVVLEQSAYVSGNPASVVPMYAAHDINAYFADHPIYVVMPSARPITLNNAVGGARVRAVLSSTLDAYAKTDPAFSSSAYAPGDLNGPFTLAATADSAGANKRGAIFLAGSRLIFADDVMRAQAFANRIFLNRALSYLWEEAQTVSIPPKMFSDTVLPVTARQTLTAGIALIGALPLLVLALGAIVCVRRRRR